MITAVRIPESPAAAAAYAAGGGRIMAGGTVVMAEVNTTPVEVSELVSLRRAGMSGIEVDGGMARIGATTTFADLARCPELGFLHEAMHTLASPTIRNQATVGGNLFVRQPYGDFAVCLLALDADVEITGAAGARTAPVDAVLTDGVRTDEVVTAVRFVVPAEGTWFYHKAMRRKLNSAAIVAVAAVVRSSAGQVRPTADAVRPTADPLHPTADPLHPTAGGVVISARIALGGVARRPVRSPAAEHALIGRPLTRAVLDDAGQAARADIAPFDDSYASAWYRDRVLPVHFRRAFLD
jgi:CO/xanthine dehydrogenase FAD-binding subunit